LSQKGKERPYILIAGVIFKNPNINGFNLGAGLKISFYQYKELMVRDF
jgi:hypothetical protein